MSGRWEQALAVADAVLYEGYLLYPYRANSAKNQCRWQFGVLGPTGAERRQRRRRQLSVGAARRASAGPPADHDPGPVPAAAAPIRRTSP